MPEDVNRIQELLEDINKSLSYTGEDGKVIHISEAFKTLPELAAKYGSPAPVRSAIHGALSLGKPRSTSIAASTSVYGPELS